LYYSFYLLVLVVVVFCVYMCWCCVYTRIKIYIKKLAHCEVIFTWYKNIANRFFGLVTKHACVSQTDGQTDVQNYDSQDRASVAASRGKNRQSSLLESTMSAVSEFHTAGAEQRKTRSAKLVLV